MFLGPQRSKSILTRVRIALGNPDDVKMPSELIFVIASEKQRDIAERFLVVESSMPLSVIAGTATYDLTTVASAATGFFRLKLLAAPTNTRVSVVELDLSDFDFSQRYATSSPGLPVWYVRLWAGQLTFFPTPTASATWTIWFFKSPTTVMSKTVAPETPSSFDQAIVYGTIAELDPSKMGVYLPLYGAAVREAVNAFRSTRTECNNIVYQDV